MNNPIFPGVGKCLMIHKARQGTRNLERRGNVAYFSSLCFATLHTCILLHEDAFAWTPNGNHTTTIPGINATERCQTCDRVIFVIFTSYL